MSIQTMKKKGVINYGSRRSAREPAGYWVSRGPHTIPPVEGYVGFSINGGRRSQGYIGQSSAFSKSGTPYYGQFAKGYGGYMGEYYHAEPLMNSPIVKGDTSGKQFEYIKPSVLSTKGMLETRFRWRNNGTYPNYWVQPVYPTGYQDGNASQQAYIEKKASANTIVTDTNKPEKYIDYRIKGNPATGCSTTPAKHRSYFIASSNRGYTKTLYQPQTSSQHMVKIQRKCSHPVGHQKPFPFATNGGTGNSGAGINYASPAVSQIYYTEPPEWYTAIGVCDAISLIA